MAAVPLAAQDVGNVVDNVRNIKRQPLSISGGLGISNNFYTSTGIDPRRDALTQALEAAERIAVAPEGQVFVLRFDGGIEVFEADGEPLALPLTREPAGVRPISASAVWVLPDPDSPTMPSNSPSRRLNPRLSTA